VTSEPLRVTLYDAGGYRDWSGKGVDERVVYRRVRRRTNQLPWPNGASILTAAPSPAAEGTAFTLKPGRRDEMIDMFERNFIEAHEQEGASVIGHFRDLDDPHRFVWLRGFRDMLARKEALEPSPAATSGTRTAMPSTRRSSITRTSCCCARRRRDRDS